MRTITYNFPPSTFPTYNLSGSIDAGTKFPLGITAQQLGRWGFLVEEWQVEFDVSWSLSATVQEGFDSPFNISDNGDASGVIEFGSRIYSEESGVLALNGAYSSYSGVLNCGSATSTSSLFPSDPRNRTLKAESLFSLLIPQTIEEYESGASDFYECRWLEKDNLYLPSIEFELTLSTQSGFSYFGYNPSIRRSKVILNPAPSPSSQAYVELDAFSLDLKAGGINESPPPPMPDPDSTYVWDIDLNVDFNIVIKPSKFFNYDPMDGSGAIFDGNTGEMIRDMY